MTLYPAADWRPLAEGNPPQRMTAHDIVCVHTMAGYLGGTETMFRKDGWDGTESHFGVGGPADPGLDGTVYQWVDTDFRADANFEGNARLISIETSDGADATQPWSEAQLDAITGIIVWACQEYGIPAELVADSTPGLRGIGYHRQGIDPWRVAGGETWSKAHGKVCPGDVRIQQLLDDVIPRVQQQMGGGAPVGGVSTALRLDAVDPAFASAGDQVVLSGEGFDAADGVAFGDVWADSWTIDDDSRITATVPEPVTSGAVSLSVSSPDGSSEALSFAYRDESSAPLSLTSIDPGSGPTGSTVVLTGSGFTGADGVSFGDVWVQEWTIDDDEHITATVPDPITSGPVWVVVTTPDASSESVSFGYDE